MKVVIQRVTRASVTIEQQLFSSIGKGMLILVGIQSVTRMTTLIGLPPKL